MRLRYRKQRGAEWCCRTGPTAPISRCVRKPRRRLRFRRDPRLSRGTGFSRRFDLKYRFDTVEFCPAFEDARDPYRLDLKNCAELNIDTEATKAAASTAQQRPVLQDGRLPRCLQPNTDWGVCLRWKNPPAGTPLPLCQLFSVHAPFLQYPVNSLARGPPLHRQGFSGGQDRDFWRGGSRHEYQHWDA